jgi:predicted DNA-binding transcriptional regulator YafY
VAGTDEIKYWLMSWGGKAEVLSPATLRDEMIAEAQKMLRCYQV